MTESKPTEEKTDPKYTLLKNIKYGNKVYKLGQKINIKEKDLDEFKKAGAIKIE
jgi:hypothetical protein